MKNKKIFFVFLLGALMFTGIVYVAAESLIAAQDVAYRRSNGQIVNVEDAINDLYSDMGFTISSISFKTNDSVCFNTSRKYNKITIGSTYTSGFAGLAIIADNARIYLAPYQTTVKDISYDISEYSTVCLREDYYNDQGGVTTASNIVFE